MNKKQGVIIMTMSYAEFRAEAMREVEMKQAAWERLQVTPLDKIVNKSLRRTLTAEEIAAVKWLSKIVLDKDLSNHTAPEFENFNWNNYSRELDRVTHSLCEVANLVEDYKSRISMLVNSGNNR